MLLVVTAFAVGFAVYRHQLEREAAIELAVLEIAAFDENSNDPAELLYVLKSLQTLGQSDAVEAIQRFNKQEQYSPKPGIIIPLIFALRQPTDKYPSPSYDQIGQSFELTNDDWGYVDIELHGDIPFRTDCLVFASSTMGFDERYLIDWAGQNGTMQTDPLIPTSDPFCIADKLIDELLERAIESRDQPDERVINSMRETITTDIHHQVYKLIGHLIPYENLKNWNNLAETYRLWNRIRNKCTTGGMKWDTNSKQYEFSQ
jgi:hypothetical protein